MSETTLREFTKIDKESVLADLKYFKSRFTKHFRSRVFRLIEGDKRIGRSRAAQLSKTIDELKVGAIYFSAFSGE